MYVWIRDLAPVALALAAVLASGCRAAPPASEGHDHAGHDPARADAIAGDAVAHYTCSMHPSVKGAEPGICPICSMALLPVFQREIASGEIVLDAGRRQRIGVTTARAERRLLTVPVRAAGQVTYDQTRLTDVTVKVGGWIEELQADRLGQPVRKGEPLFTLYSADLFTAQQEYLDALENRTAAVKSGAPNRADYLVQVRRERLRLWDMGPDLVKRMEATGAPIERVPILSPATGNVIEKNVVAGAAVEPGATLFRIADLDRVWVEAEVYESELGLLAVGDPATVTLPYLPGRSFTGRIGFVYPWLDSATRTGRVRIELANPGLALKPEMYAEVLVESALGERLAVPDEAILYAGDRRYVFRDLGEGRLRPQAVTLGHRAGDWMEILDGLEPGDVVVTSGNFLIAAEARLKLALDHWAPEPEGAGEVPPVHDHGAHAGHGEPPDPAGHEAHAGHGVPAGDRGHAGHPDPGAGAGAGAHAGHGEPSPGAGQSPPAGHEGHAGHAPPAARTEPAAPPHDHAAHAGAHPAGHGAAAADPAAAGGHAGHGEHAQTAPEAPEGHDSHAGHDAHAGHEVPAAQPEPRR